MRREDVLVHPDSSLNDVCEGLMNQNITAVATKSGRDGSANDEARFAFVQSCWHREIVDQGRDSFLSEMRRRGIAASRIDLYEVPGAFELPLHAKVLGRSGRYAAVVACGFVVNGGIYRHEFVAEAVISGLMSVQLEIEVPVISAVLTPRDFHDHEEHRKFFHDHFRVKGIEAAAACVSTAAALDRVRDVAEAA
ncbi:6,7-dimethyl-8-ribityllumazine synthase [Enhydrobacter aerosaccus]|uniref:6,7-dimethyl-8-ribityllumazine synthase n=1 Tax=Enhydrobacter aerosaccus TaxID=225324 RepID=UPI001E295B83|nr:6,7-dimethyl-8-ribityllumazine synthase [Enhydrobacter aerosaccus]